MDKKRDNDNTKDSTTILSEVAKSDNNNSSKKGLNERLLIRKPNNLISLEILRKSSLTSKIASILLLFETIKVI